MNFETYIYKPSPDKEKLEFRETLFLIGVIFVMFLIFIFLFRGLLMLIAIGIIAFSLVAIKIKENKKKGVNRVGSLSVKMSLTNELLTIGNSKYKISELRNLEINARDYFGRTSDFFWTKYGINNHISFVNNGMEHSYQFQIKRKKDIKLISDILNNNNNIAANK